jgi:hypothetical protein
MTGDALVARDPRESGPAERQHSCLCCGRVIPGLLDEDPSVGLAPKLGLVSDECAFICNDCTAGLIDARLVTRSGATRAR